ncbi:MAG: Gfo/Idh/MocA family oxidoreductase [Actinomycetota bacterium]|nr:Gfo/Idh/MocA family oxidoreductase [Actinomycetota bacterium]
MSERAVAIIGYGLAGRFFHAPLIRATAGLRVAAIVTADPQRSAQAAHEHPDAAVMASTDELFGRAAEFDAVVIATANDSHVPLATRAVDHGLAVVVDKPLALTAAEAEDLIARARAAGVLLTVFQNRRWDSDQLTLSRLMAQGALGQVLRYESRFERWRPESRPEAWRERTPPAQGGGVLLDLGSHLVDQALVHFGAVTSVYAEVSSRRGAPADDDVFIALTHRCGTISHLRASAVTAAPGPRLRVLGSEAALIVRDLDSQEDRLRAGERPDTVSDWGVEPSHAHPRLITGEQSVPLVPERGAWQTFYARLRDALVAGGSAPPVPPVDASDVVSVLCVLEAARASALSGEVAKLA